LSEIFFEVETPLGFKVRTTQAYWQKITSFKHPIMKGRERSVIEALKEPCEVRRSKRDPRVFLFYAKTEKYWVCAVAKRLNGEGFLVTAYLTDKIKEGEKIWPK